MNSIGVGAMSRQNFRDGAAQTALDLMLFHGDHRPAFLRKLDDLLLVNRLHGMAVEHHHVNLLFFQLPRREQCLI